MIRRRRMDGAAPRSRLTPEQYAAHEAAEKPFVTWYQRMNAATTIKEQDACGPCPCGRALDDNSKPVCNYCASWAREGA